MPLAEALDHVFEPSSNTFFDLPGHGKSGRWDGEDFHSDALDVAAGLLEGPTHLVGHSFGATVALRMAIAQPNLVSRLTLIEPVMFAAASRVVRRAHDAASAPFVTAYRAGDLEGAAQVFTKMWGTGVAWSDLPDKHRQRIVSQIKTVIASAPAIEDDVHGIMARLGAVTCRVDLIEGTDSQPVMTAIMDGLEAGLPQSQRTRIRGAGHMLPITHPVQTARALNQP